MVTSQFKNARHGLSLHRVGHHMKETLQPTSIVCPKCKSARILIVKLEGRNEYRCELNGDVDRFCNWKEVEFLDSERNRKNDHSPFLSTFLFHDYDDAKLEFEHLYLLGERLHIKKMIVLHKQGELLDVLARTVVEMHPEWSNAPIRHVYEATRRDFLARRLDETKDCSKPLVVVDGVLDDVSILARTSIDDRIRLFKQFTFDLLRERDRVDNIFVFLKNGFLNDVYIPLCEEFILAFNQVHQEQPGCSLSLKRCIVIPFFSGDLLVHDGMDEQAMHVLHFATREQHYYDKVAIAEESFWKRWEFGSRNAPYNPYGKDAGSFWIRTRLAPIIAAELEGKSPSEQKHVINNSGQEKFQFISLTLPEALSRCILLGTSINASVELWTVFPGPSTVIRLPLQHACEKLHRMLVVKE